jgi:hypothetical protein
MSSGAGCRLVHTTQLRDAAVANSSTRRAPILLALKGPLLLIPRVGLPSHKKIVVYKLPNRIVPSDCIFALSGQLHLLEDAQQRILHSWDVFRSWYGGSCAPYITTRRLFMVLTNLGIELNLEARLERLLVL